jgi:hypothetical protein
MSAMSAAAPADRSGSTCRGACLLLALLAGAAVPRAHATDWEASLDARLVNSDAERSFMDGGLGSVRFDRTDSTLQLGRARFALTQSFAEIWSAHLDASVWDDKDAHLLGATEAYLQLRPYPRAGYRLRVKAGAFYPPVSLENRASGWESPYTLSYSAINSWLATEVRTIGAEAQLEWLGTRLGHAFDLEVTGAVFGWNDQAGVVLANDGFLLHDRQTPVFGRVGQPNVPPLNGAKPFLELDGRAGAYAGLEARYLDRLVLRVLRYDNGADPTQIDSVAGVIAWDTRFTSAGARLETQGGWTFIAQGLDGDTLIAPHGFMIRWPFRAGFGLVSRRFGRHTLSARYDRFWVHVQGLDGDGTQSGHAWTAAYAFDAGAHWRVSLEWLQVTSDSYNRQELYGGPLAARETQVQLAVRYALGSALR